MCYFQTSELPPSSLVGSTIKIATHTFEIVYQEKSIQNFTFNIRKLLHYLILDSV